MKETVDTEYGNYLCFYGCILTAVKTCWLREAQSLEK